MRRPDWKSSAVLLTAALLLSSSPSARAFDMNAGVSKESGPFDLFKFGFNAYKKGQKEEAVEAYRYAAEKGHTGSRWALANMYEAGDGVVDHALVALGEVEAHQLQISQIAAAATQLAATSQGVAQSCEQASGSAQHTQRTGGQGQRQQPVGHRRSRYENSSCWRLLHTSKRSLSGRPISTCSTSGSR